MVYLSKEEKEVIESFKVYLKKKKKLRITELNQAPNSFKKNNFLNMKNRPISMSKTSMSILKAAISMALLFISNAAFAQKDYSFYFTKKTPDGMDKKVKKAELEANEALAAAYFQDSTFVQTLDSTQITNLFYHLMSDVYISELGFDVPLAKKYRLTLIRLSKDILKNNRGTWLAKYSAISLIQWCLQRDILFGSSNYRAPRLTVDRYLADSLWHLSTAKRNLSLGNQESYIADKEYTRLVEFKEKDRMILFFKFLSKPEAFDEKALLDLESTFLRSGEDIKASHVKLYLLTKKNISADEANEFLGKAASMSNLPFDFLRNSFPDNWKKVTEAIKTNNEYIKTYVEKLNILGKSAEAMAFLKSLPETPEIKYMIFEAILADNGINDAARYLMDQKPRASVAYSILSEKCKKISPTECLSLTKFLLNNYKAAFDSVDITCTAGFEYWSEGEVHRCACPIYSGLEKKDVFYFINLYESNGYDQEAAFVEYQFWSRQSLTFNEIEKMIANKSMKVSTAAATLFERGKYCIDEEARGSANRDILMNTCIPMLLKSAKYDPSNANVYKYLGDAYSFYGNGNKAQEYYIKASRMGADMRDRTSASGNKKIITGKRGGKYYINSNGNKTYLGK